jgi:hypothetical protein
MSSVDGSAVVVPAGSTVAGKTIGQWTADWWNWAGAGPANVFTDTTGAAATQNQSGPVFFLAGTQGGTPVTRTFEIPSGKFVLFPLINIIVAAGPDVGFTDTRQEATAFADAQSTATFVANIDGTDVPDLASHREASPTNFTYVVNAGTSGFPAGTYTDANSDGYWLMLEPLSAGEHTIHFGGTSNDFGPAEGNVLLPSFTVDVTDQVTVPGTAAIPLPAGALAAMPVMAAIAGAGAWRRRQARA